MEEMSILIAAAVSLIVGVAIFWLISRRSYHLLEEEKNRWHQLAETAQAECHDVKVSLASLMERVSRLQEVEEKVDALQEDNRLLRQQTVQAQTALNGNEQLMDALKHQLDILTGQYTEQQAKLERLQTEHAAKDALIAQLKTAIAGERKAADEKIELLTQAKEKLGEQFRRVAEEVLETRTKRITDQHQFNLTTLLNPLKAKLEEFQQRVEVNHQADIRDRAMLSKQVEMLTQLNQQIGEEAKNLTQALKGDNKTQGTWGEIVLERILEVAGLVKGREYDTQVSTTQQDEQGNLKTLRPDVVIHMPGDRHLIVDAKVSLTAFERYVNADNDKDQSLALRQHIDSIRGHIKSLSGKDYRSIYELKSVDFVIMFIATEPAFLTAVSHDPELYAEAWGQHVMLTGPSTLLFALRMVERLWQQEKQTSNAEKILKSAAALYDKFHGFYEDFEGIGFALTRAQTSFEEAGKKLKEGRGNLYNRIEALASQKLVSPKKRLKQVEGMNGSAHSVEDEEKAVLSLSFEETQPIAEDRVTSQ